MIKNINIIKNMKKKFYNDIYKKTYNNYNKKLNKKLI